MKKIFNKSNLPTIILNLSTVLIISILLFTNNVFAKSNQASTTETTDAGILSYQGILQDNSGNPESGLFDMVFSIYNSPTTLVPLWVENHSGLNAVLVENGLFNVLLGSLNPIPISVWNQPQLFLGIKVGNDPEMSPRDIFSAPPFAINAAMAQSVPVASLNSTHVNFTSGFKNATGDVELISTYQLIPGMQSTITIDTPQTLFVTFTVYFTSEASSSYGIARVKVVGDGGTFTSPLIVKRWPATDTCTLSYLIDLPPGTYQIEASAKSYSGAAYVRSAHTHMSWFTFSQ